jgi:hypothetical protein
MLLGESKLLQRFKQRTQIKTIGRTNLHFPSKIQCVCKLFYIPSVRRYLHFPSRWLLLSIACQAAACQHARFRRDRAFVSGLFISPTSSETARFYAVVPPVIGSFARSPLSTPRPQGNRCVRIAARIPQFGNCSGSDFHDSMTSLIR